MGTGIGVEIHRASVITPDMENKLWMLGILGTNSPKALLNVVFMTIKIFFYVGYKSMYIYVSVSSPGARIQSTIPMWSTGQKITQVEYLTSPMERLWQLCIYGEIVSTQHCWIYRRCLVKQDRPPTAFISNLYRFDHGFGILQLEQNDSKLWSRIWWRRPRFQVILLTKSWGLQGQPHYLMQVFLRP